MSEFGKDWTIKYMRIERIEHFVAREHFLLSAGAFRLATGIAARRLRDGFPLGYLEPGDAAAATPAAPLIIVPLTTISVRPLDAPTVAELQRLEHQLYDRLMQRSWPLYRRVAHELLQLLEFPKLVAHERSHRAIRVTQSVLAELIGASREAVANELRALAAAGAVRTEYGRIAVLDAPLLTQAARQTTSR